MLSFPVSSSALLSLSNSLASLPTADLIPISNSILDHIPKITHPDDAQMLELVPKCLSLVNDRDYINSAIEKLLGLNWNRVVLVKFVSILRDFTFLSAARRSEFLQKVFQGMKGLELQDLPSMVYQLLVLASKGFSKREVLEGIVRYFGEKTGSSSSTIIRQVEGTALLHVNFAVKQDPLLGKEIVGMVKSDFRVLNHFTVAMVLSIARVGRYSESSIGILKTAVTAVYRDYSFAKDCKWLPNGLVDEYQKDVKMVEKAVLRAIHESNYGREHILPSIVKFGFLLLEAVEERNIKEFGKLDGLMGVEELGIQALTSLFEVHEMSRNEIIEQCKYHILSLKPEQSLPIIRFLGHLIHKYPYQSLEHVSRLKELLDYFIFMHGNISSRLITIMLPLIKISRELQDYIILVVHKAMFSRENSVRVAATNAIIELILVDKQTKADHLFSCQDSSSQASSSQKVELASSMPNLFQQLSSLLQRCLYQQAQVKRIIYHGLVKVVLADPLSAGVIYDLLSPHFLRFYKENEDMPLRIDHCVKSKDGKVCVEEPVDCFLSCVSWILLLQPHGKEYISESWAFGFSLTQGNEGCRLVSGESFSSALSKIRKFLNKGSLEGSLCPTQDTGSSQDERKRYHALLLSGIIEVVINIVATELEKASDSKRVDLLKELTELVDAYESLGKYVGAKQLNGTQKGITRFSTNDVEEKNNMGTAMYQQDGSSFVATSSLYQLLQIALEHFNSDNSTSVTTSQNRTQASLGKVSVTSFKLVSFLLNASVRHFRSFFYVRKDDPLNTLIYGDIKILGPLLIKLVWLLLLGPSSKTTQKRREVRARKDLEDRKEFFFLALTCLKELISISFSNPEHRGLIEDLISTPLPEYASSCTLHLDWDNEYEHGSPSDYPHAKYDEMFLDKCIRPLFTELLAVSLHRQVEILCDIILMIGTKLPSQRRNIVGSWALQICKTSNLSNSKLAKSIVTLALTLRSLPHDLILAKDMAVELSNVVGSEITEPLEISEVYPLINKSTHPVVASSILQLIDTVVTDMDWITMKLKTLKHTPNDQSGDQAPDLVMEEALYFVAESSAKVLSSFAAMKLKDAQAEQFLRLATRLYKNLARVSKLLIAPRGRRQVLPSVNYQRLVEVTCRQLTAPLYNFVTSMQNNQQGSASNKGTINKIKRENRCIPDLIFQIEDYEKYLIQLSKATKVNLLRHAKRSTSRDFKISNPSETVDEGDPVTNQENEHGDSVTTAQGETGAELENYDNVAVEASECSSEGEDSVPNAKRAKMTDIVQDSDDEE